MGGNLWVIIALLLFMPMASPAPLRILVPLKAGFREFASGVSDPGSSPDNYSLRGFAVEVFRTCMSNPQSSRPYEFYHFGDGNKDPSYDEMVNMLVNKTADVVVADLTITSDRIKKVDFTQPYIQSTLVMVVPFRYGSPAGIWDFLQPFSARLWASIVGLFLTTGLVLHVVEHSNPFHNHEIQLGEAQQACWHTRISNVFWFMALTIFFAQRSEVSTKIGRIITILWLFVVLILTSTYTASLSSILTAQQEYPTIQSFQQLRDSSLPVGYQDGSFVYNFLQNSTITGIEASRLRRLENETDYEAALNKGATNGGVAAILDELPYVESFLSSTSCSYTTVGGEIAYFGGFSFALQKNSTLTNELSTALIALEQSGELRTIRDKWLPDNNTQCNSAQGGVQLRSFGGLFIIIVVLYAAAVLYRLLHMIYDSRRTRKLQFNSEAL